MAFLYRYRGLLRLLAIAALVLLVVLGTALIVSLFTHWWMVAGLAVLALVLFVLGRRAARWVPRRTILEVNFERGVVERGKRTFPGGAERRPLVLRNVVDALDRASRDRRVVGLLARVGSFSPGLAVAQELRDAVKAFRASGKRAVAWAETLGEGQSATVEMFLAAGFDEVIVQPTGEVGLTGVLVEQPFARETFEKLGVEPQLDHRREYKTAKYMFTERSMPEPQRESLQALLDSQVELLVTGIGEGRGMEPARVRELLDGGPYSAKQALAHGLVDSVAYRDEVYEATKTTLKGRLLNLDVYLRRAGRPHRKGSTIAVVHGTGTIVRGKSRPPGPGGARFGSDDVAAAIRKAAKAKRVKAIVFRVDSPGGSAVASDVVLREVKRAREQGTPVIVSMGNVAASGGYYVACGANEIVADAGTITGSIGVVFGKFVVRDLWRRLGVAWESLKVGESAEFWSGRHPFDEEGWAKAQRMLDEVYADFKERVAEGRGLSAEAVEAVARGRVWTGVQALEHGLVDRLGGLDVALERAKSVAGIDAKAPVHVQVVPKPKRFLTWGVPESSEAAMVALSEVSRVGEALGVLGADGTGRLRMPPLLLSTSAGQSVSGAHAGWTM